MPELDSQPDRLPSSSDRRHRDQRIAQEAHPQLGAGREAAHERSYSAGIGWASPSCRSSLRVTVSGEPVKRASRE